jgi:hypothetical protein
MWDILKETVVALVDLPQHFFTIDGRDANLSHQYYFSS